jgi:hypothetical protein
MAGAMVLAAAMLVRAQREAPPIPKGTNVLVGRVLEMGGDRPIADAVVTLIGYFEASGRATQAMPQSTNDPTASAPRYAMTTADGYVVFRDLPAGRYSMAADAFGFASSAYPPRVVELTNRDAPTDVSLRLWRYASITGTVIDERGEPVVGAAVAAFRHTTGARGVALRFASQTVRTDDRGVYRLAPLTPGRYVVGVVSSSLSLPASFATAIDASAANRAEAYAMSIAAIYSGTMVQSGEGQRIGDFVLRRPGPPPVFSPGGRLLTYATTLYPGTPSPSSATVVTLGSGDARTGIDIPIRFAPVVSVSGIVTGPEEVTKHLTVELWPSTGAVVNVAFEPEGLARAITDEHGAFRFLDVSPGSYELRVTYLVAANPNVGTTETSWWAAQPVAIGDRDVDGLSIALQPGVRASGRVAFKGATDAHVPRLNVYLESIDSDARALAFAARPDGTFTALGSRPGRYMVSVLGPPDGWMLESVTRAGRSLPDGVADLEAAGADDLVLTLSKTFTRVSGSITSANQAAASNADVIVFPADTTFWREGVVSSRRMRLVHATSASTFELDGLAPGEYDIVAIDAESIFDWRDPASLERVRPSATAFALGAGEQKTLTLRTTTPKPQ